LREWLAVRAQYRSGLGLHVALRLDILGEALVAWFIMGQMLGRPVHVGL